MQDIKNQDNSVIWAIAILVVLLFIVFYRQIGMIMLLIACGGVILVWIKRELVKDLDPLFKIIIFFGILTFLVFGIKMAFGPQPFNFKDITTNDSMLKDLGR